MTTQQRSKHVAQSMAATALLALAAGCATHDEQALACAAKSGSTGDDVPPVIISHPGPHQLSVDVDALDTDAHANLARVRLHIRIKKDSSARYGYQVVPLPEKDEEVFY